MTDNSIYYGSPTIQPSIVPLEAGPLSVIFQDGFLRSISCKNVEIAKRIYFALRDQYWNTIPGKIESLKIDSSVDSFLITFTCNYIHNDINFSCFAEISGSNKGKLEFYIKGVAKSTFLRNRIGFCTLHPVDLCTGKMCTVNHVDGTVYKKAFPVFIEPWQPFKDIRGLEYNINDSSSVKFTFEGDTFECEDQRNWTDNSFKLTVHHFLFQFPRHY
jgi:D-apionolactonase